MGILSSILFRLMGIQVAFFPSLISFEEVHSDGDIMTDWEYGNDPIIRFNDNSEDE